MVIDTLSYVLQKINHSFNTINTGQHSAIQRMHDLHYKICYYKNSFKLNLTVQIKIFKRHKFRRFHCFPSKRNNYMAKNYSCDPQNQNSNKSAKFIAHEIFALYSILTKGHKVTSAEWVQVTKCTMLQNRRVFQCLHITIAN